MGRQILYALVLAAAIAGTGATARAATYDIASDFLTGPGNNPNGVWSYGFTPTVPVITPGVPPALVLYDVSGTDTCGHPFWNSSVVQSLGAPAVFDNPTGGALNCGIYVHPAHTAAFHPGQQDQFSIYRFTTPSAGNYALDATFTVLDPATGGTDVHILNNGTQIYSADNTGGPTGTVFGSYNQNLSLAAGDLIDFAVGYGRDNSFFSDSTGINASLTTGAAVPEPSTLLFLAAGLPGLGFIRRRTR